MTAYLCEERLLESIRNILAEAKLGRSCIGCARFDAMTEGCSAADGARPPARVIVDGCIMYESAPPF